jgi:VanZ family protein
VANLTPPVRWSNADKAAHLVEYTLLGFLLVRAFYGARVFAAMVACGLLAVVAGLTTGIADEIFQAGVPGRVSSAADFRMDALGVVLGVIAYALARRLRPD